MNPFESAWSILKALQPSVLDFEDTPEEDMRHFQTMQQMQETYTLEEMKVHAYGLLKQKILCLLKVKIVRLSLTPQMIKYIDTLLFIICQMGQNISNVEFIYLYHKNS